MRRFERHSKSREGTWCLQNGVGCVVFMRLSDPSNAAVFGISICPPEPKSLTCKCRNSINKIHMGLYSPVFTQAVFMRSLAFSLSKHAHTYPRPSTVCRWHWLVSSINQCCTRWKVDLNLMEPLVIRNVPSHSMAGVFHWAFMLFQWKKSIAFFGLR